MSIDFEGVVAAWDADGAAGGHAIHPLPVDSAEWWALGEIQAAQVAEHAEADDLVVDFGCGLGRLAIPLARLGFDVVAVDSSPAMLDGLAQRARASGVSLDVHQSDGSDLLDILGDMRAAVVVARAVLIHHDYAGTERIVTALAAALEPGGVLIADWHVSDTPVERSDWTGVTTWHPHHRDAVARLAGLEPIEAGDAPAWRKVDAP